MGFRVRECGSHADRRRRPEPAQHLERAGEVELGDPGEDHEADVELAHATGSHRIAAPATGRAQCRRNAPAPLTLHARPRIIPTDSISIPYRFHTEKTAVNLCPKPAFSGPLKLHFEFDDLVGLGQRALGPFLHQRPGEDRVAIAREPRVELDRIGAEAACRPARTSRPRSSARRTGTARRRSPGTRSRSP